MRDDYRVLELSIIFLGGDVDKNLKIGPPGAIHEARLEIEQQREKRTSRYLFVYYNGLC